MNNSPLKITFNMQTPVCLTYPFIFFDGLLAHLMNRKLNNLGYRSLPSKRVVRTVGGDSVPLERTDGLWHGSVSFFDVNEPSSTIIYKRFCEKYFDSSKTKKSKIQRGSGHFRDYMIRLVYLPAKKTVFYAKGDKKQIRDMLLGLPGLGKKTAIGFGFFNSFKIEEVDEDYSIVKDGVAMRPIPLPLVASSSEKVMMAYRPPYWAKQNVTLCVPPHSKVELVT